MKTFKQFITEGNKKKQKQIEKKAKEARKSAEKAQNKRIKQLKKDPSTAEALKNISKHVAGSSDQHRTVYPDSGPWSPTRMAVIKHMEDEKRKWLDSLRNNQQ